jgi:hypothetical protein
MDSASRPKADERPPLSATRQTPHVMRVVAGSCRLVPAAPRPHAIALALGREHGGVVGLTIEERGGEFLVAGKDGDPFRETETRGDHGGAALVAVGDQIEEQLAADAIEGHEAELVDDQHLDPQQPLLQARQLAAIAGLEQLAHGIGRPREQHPTLLFGGFDAERDRKWVLPVPIGPARIRFSGAVTHSPRASVWICVALRPSAIWKSKVSRVLVSGKRASRRRCRMTDSCRQVCSALSTSCR